MKRMFFREMAILLVLALLVPMFSVAEDGGIDLSGDAGVTEEALELEGVEAVDFEEIEAVEALSLDALSEELSGGEPEDSDAGLEADADAQLNEVENASKKYGVPTALTLGVKETFALKCTKTKLTYKSSSAKIAKVSKKGVITAVKNGKATITVYSDKKKLTTCKVTVVAAPKKVTVKPKTLDLEVGQSYALSATLPKKTASNKLTWTTSNKQVATVDQNGTVTGVKAGKAVITVKTFNGKKNTCAVTVRAPEKKEPEYRQDKLKKLSEKGVKDPDALSFIREVNGNITDINKSINSYNKKVASAEKERQEITESVLGTNVRENANEMSLSWEGTSLKVDSELMQKLADGAKVELLDTTDDAVVMNIGGIRCNAILSGDRVCITTKSVSSNAGANTASNDLNDKDYEKSKSKRLEMIANVGKIKALKNQIDKKLLEAENKMDDAIGDLKKLINKCNTTMSDKSQSKIARDMARNNKRAFELDLEEMLDKANLIRAIRIGIQGLNLADLIKHTEELASRWQESLEIYKHYHLKDSDISYSYTLEQSAKNLDMYIKRLWLNYTVDAVLCTIQGLSIATAISIEICKIFGLSVKGLTMLAAKLGPTGIWGVAVVALFNFIHKELYKRNYEFMKQEDDRLHSYFKIKVIDEDTGAPLKGVKVTWASGLASKVVRYTDDKGLLDLHVIPGSWELTFEHDDYETVVKRSSGSGYRPLKKEEYYPLTVKMESLWITFGHYEQDNNLANGPEPIQWQVLKQDGDTLTLISRYGLDCKPYNTECVDITWQNCSLRAWLNGAFLSSAFTSAEQAKLQTVTVKAEDNPHWGTEAGNDTRDKVYLLSISEALNLFASDADRQCKATAYAKARDGGCWWWLRSPGDFTSCAANIINYGHVNYYGLYVCNGGVAVRPVVCLRLS